MINASGVRPTARDARDERDRDHPRNDLGGTNLETCPLHGDAEGRQVEAAATRKSGDAEESRDHTGRSRLRVRVGGHDDPPARAEDVAERVQRSLEIRHEMQDVRADDGIEEMDGSPRAYTSRSRHSTFESPATLTRSSTRSTMDRA